jgi:hypothetical protein
MATRRPPPGKCARALLCHGTLNPEPSGGDFAQYRSSFIGMAVAISMVGFGVTEPAVAKVRKGYRNQHQVNQTGECNDIIIENLDAQLHLEIPVEVERGVTDIHYMPRTYVPQRTLGIFDVDDSAATENGLAGLLRVEYADEQLPIHSSSRLRKIHNLPRNIYSCAWHQPQLHELKTTTALKSTRQIH